MQDAGAVDAGFDALGYSHATGASGGWHLAAGEVQLWCAVIAQAFVDAGFVTAVNAPRAAEVYCAEESKRRSEARRDAVEWLLYGGRDFFEVCLRAGVSGAVVRRAAMLAWLRNGGEETE